MYYCSYGRYSWPKCSSRPFKERQHIKHPVQTALKPFTYSYLDLDFKNFRADKKRIKVLRSLKEWHMVLKPDKGQGIVDVNKKD